MKLVITMMGPGENVAVADQAAAWWSERGFTTLAAMAKLGRWAIAVGCDVNDRGEADYVSACTLDPEFLKSLGAVVGSGEFDLEGMLVDA